MKNQCEIIYFGCLFVEIGGISNFCNFYVKIVLALAEESEHGFSVVYDSISLSRSDYVQSNDRSFMFFDLHGSGK